MEGSSPNSAEFRFPQASPSIMESKTDEKPALSSGSSASPRWMFALSDEELTSESDELLQWLGRFPIDSNHPRPLIGKARRETDGDVLTINQTDKITSVFRSLVAQGFLGAPIVDASQRYVGYVDMLDLVFFVCEMFRSWFDDSGSAGPPINDSWAKFFLLDRFREATVQDMFASMKMLRSRTPCYPAYRGFSTLWAFEQMARLGCRRIPILGSDSKVHNICTQSMMISLLAQSLDKLGTLRYMKVSELMPGLARDLKTVAEDSLTIRAFKMMATNNLSGLPVVNAQGELVDTLSVRDLRGIGTKAGYFERLWIPVKEFKAEVRKSFPQQTPSLPITVEMHDTLETVLKRMDDGNIGRVVVVEKRNDNLTVPVRVISHRDVLTLVCFRMGMQPIWDVKPVAF